MYTHITNSRITNLKNAPSREQMRTVAKTGKPAGLWYAYGDEWKAHFYNINNSKKAAWKYTLNLKDDDFTEDYTKSSPNKILRVNKTNFADTVAKYGKEFIKSNNNILEDLIYRRQSNGDETLDFLLGSKPISCSENNSINNNNNSIRNLPEDLKDLANDIYSLICEYINIEDISPESLKLLIKEIDERYSEPPYITFDWPGFWRKLAENFAGIEFSGDVLDVVEIPSPNTEIRSVISVSFMPFVEIHSGVIFKPASFFAGREAWIEEEIKEGGQRNRKTRKYKRHYKKTKKRITHKK